MIFSILKIIFSQLSIQWIFFYFIFEDWIANKCRSRYHLTFRKHISQLNNWIFSIFKSIYFEILYILFYRKFWRFWNRKNSIKTIWNTMFSLKLELQKKISFTLSLRKVWHKIFISFLSMPSFWVICRKNIWFCDFRKVSCFHS